MSKNQITIESLGFPHGQRTCNYEEVSTCPLCHVSIVPTAIFGCYTPQNDPHHGPIVHILFLCPHCQKVFLAKYTSVDDGRYLCAYFQPTLSPKNSQNFTFPSSIQDMSPMFVATFNQSVAAESQDLTEIAGCGYRKSVEYLVKDYLCRKFPDQSETIQSEFLGKAIQRIDDPRVKTLAERATWIGNDETHYIKKHEALDIGDMKRFISAMLSYIEAELIFEEALSIEPQ